MGYAAIVQAVVSIAISYAVARLTAPDIEGPRLNDLDVGGSSYGREIPICYGTTKVAGNVIWATDLIETKHEESAKGGPDITTYSYSQHLQVLVCAGPVSGIRKIWANGRLIFDMSETNTGSTGQSGNVRIYPGTTTQTADSLLESYLGAGNVPAHRGYCHVVFESLQLEDYGNRTPSFEFEVVASGALSTSYATTIFNKLPVTTGNGWCALPGGRIFYLYVDVANSKLTGFIISDIDGSVLSSGDSPSLYQWGECSYIDGINEVWVGSDPNYILRFSADTGAYIGRIYSINYDGLINFSKTTGLAVIRDTYQNYGFRVVDPGLYVNNYPSYTGVGLIGDFRTYTTSYLMQFITGDAMLWTDGGLNWNNSLELYDVTTQRLIATISSSVINKSSIGIATEIAFDKSRNRVLWGTNANLPNMSVINAATLEVINITTDATLIGYLFYNEYTDKYYAFGTLGSGNASLVVINAETFQKDDEWNLTNLGLGDLIADTMLYSGNPGDYLLTRTDDGVRKIQINPRLAANQVALSSIVTNLCERAGLAASDIEVTALTDMVDGYKTA